jgi:cytochrome P450
VAQSFKDRLINWLVSPGFLRPVFRLLRSVCPILVFGKRAVITRHADVVEVLSRDTDFTISEINQAHIAAIDGPFILGMDRSAEYEREVGTLREVVRADDLERIRKFITESARVLVETARPQGRIDVVQGLARVVPIRLVESYFGIPAPDDPTMMRWMRAIFYDLFWNVAGDSGLHDDAVRASSELRRHSDGVISRRQSLLGEPNQPDDILGRLLALQHDGKHSWVDNNFVRRNLGGLIVGTVDNTSKSVTLAIDELLRRPNELANARKAALAGDLDAVRAYAYEAVRFNPLQPGQLRYCRHGTELARGTPRARRIPAGSTVIAATLSAMFDPDYFAQPDQFRVDRGVEYLHFGYGLHRCSGYYINGVQIPALLAALLRLPNLRRAAGRRGRINYDGPFPDRLILEFDIEANGARDSSS